MTPKSLAFHGLQEFGTGRSVGAQADDADRRLSFKYSDGSFAIASDDIVSDDGGRMWHAWEACHTWSRVRYSDVERLGDEGFVFIAVE